MSQNETSEPKRRKLDLGGFSPTPVQSSEVIKSTATRLAEESGFTARQHRTEAPAAPIEPQDVARRGRKRSTGRTTQFTVKLKPETNNAIYELAERLDANALAEVIEQAVEALREKLDRQGRG